MGGSVCRLLKVTYKGQSVAYSGLYQAGRMMHFDLFKWGASHMISRDLKR